MSLEEALEIVGADMMRLTERAEQYRAGAHAFNAAMEHTKTRTQHDFLDQRADEYLRLAARREQSAQALQLLMDAARTAAKKERANDHVPA